MQRAKAGRWWVKPQITSDLNLTDDQVQQIETIMSEIGEETAEQSQQERRATTRFHRALNQDPPNPDQVDKMRSVLEETLATRHRRRIDQVWRVRNVLTQNQWQKLWKLAPQALQVSQARIFMGPTLHVTEGTPIPAPVP